MKLLRSIAFFLTLSALVSGQLLFGQQEVAPDFFDHPAAAAQKAAPAHHQKQKHAHSTMAKKSSAKHHHSHASA